jgi:hypothetical protein
VGDLDLARDAFQAAKSKAAFLNFDSRIAAADAALAQLYFEFYRDEKKAITLWEDIVRDYPSTTPAFEASFELMPLYFYKAKDADPTEVRTWVLKMEQLAEQIESMDQARDAVPSKHETAALLGRWYADHGEMEQARAKILPLMAKSIRELTDRDTTNDYEAYAGLYRALLCFGDRRNAAIAIACTKPVRSGPNAQELNAGAGHDIFSCPAIPDDPELVSLSVIGRCDGGCDQFQTTWKSFKLCEICVNMGFCDECEQKLKDGTLKLRICDPKHPLFEVYPGQGLVTKDADGFKARLGEEKKVSLEEWLGMVSREWLGA